MKQVDLAEFVSDYLSLGGERPSAREVAAAYAERALAEDVTEAEFEVAVKKLTPQVRYYLPAPRRQRATGPGRRVT